MNLDDYAKKYSIPNFGTLAGTVLRNLARVKGSRYANQEYKRRAAAALEGFGIDRLDARAIAQMLSAQQVRLLGEYVAEQEDTQ